MSRPCSSLPKKRGAKGKPWSSKKSRRSWTNAALPFAGLRTVLPTLESLPSVLSVALFPLLACLRSLFRVALPFRNVFLKNQDIAKRIAEPKSFRLPGRRLDRRLNSASWHILLIQRLDIGDANITHGVTVGDSEVQSDPITFDHGKPLVVIGGRKAELSIKGQGLLHLSDKHTRSNRIEGGLTLLGC